LEPNNFVSLGRIAILAGKQKVVPPAGQVPVPELGVLGLKVFNFEASRKPPFAVAAIITDSCDEAIDCIAVI
jgi:hypothetical protein